MNPVALLLLAFSMSTDAFSVAISKGAGLKNPRFTEALRMGVIFGTIEAITPIIGWLIGRSATSFIVFCGSMGSLDRVRHSCRLRIAHAICWAKTW